jgi:TolB-like protein/DNA-binding SARP family transcriptional activator/Tfp pilus assembly protein PilF
MTRIHVGTLGGLRVEREGREVAELSSQPVRCALLLYVALERDAMREELLGLLWPARHPDRARHSLRQTLYELRRTLGDDWSRSRGERIEISPEVGVDALDFLAATEERRDEAALELFRGPFLEGSDPSVTPEFESWVDGWRSRLARRHREMCRRLSVARWDAGDLEGAVSVARRWVRADPLDDEAQHRLIAFLAGIGRRAEALRQYDTYVELIGRELEVEPLDETKELVEGIRAGEAPSPERGEGDSPPSPESGIPPPPPAPPIGRPASTLGRPAPTAAVPDPPPDPPVPKSASSQGRMRMAGFVGVPVLAAVLLLAFGLRQAGEELTPAPWWEAGAAPATMGIAVLPFESWGPDPDQEYFADGITEDVLTALSRVQDLRVISRTSTMRYKGTGLSSPEISRELGVELLLEGTVRREGDVVRITAQLIDGEADAHLWAEAYDRDVRDVFGVQREIAERIAAALERRLLPGAREGLAAGETDAPDAYDLLLRGRDYLNRPGETDLRKYPLAMDLFRRALEIDPDYARAYAGIAQAFRRHVALPAVPVRRDSILYHARRAIELAPELPEAATELGFGHLFSGEFGPAEDAFRRALAGDPNHPDAMDGMARVAAMGGRLDDAVRWQRRAVAVDPFSVERLWRLGSYLFDLGDLDGAEANLERAVGLAPDHPEASYLRALVHLLRGEESEAGARMAALLDVAGDHPGALFVMAQYQIDRGRYREAEDFMEGSLVAESPAGRNFRALIAHWRGEPERALEHFRETDELLSRWEEAGIPIPPLALLSRRLLTGTPEAALDVIREHWRSGMRWAEDPPRIGIYWLDRHPLVQDLREDPRFEALMSEIRRELDALRSGLSVP